MGRSKEGSYSSVLGVKKHTAHCVFIIKVGLSFSFSRFVSANQQQCVCVCVFCVFVQQQQWE